MKLGISLSDSIAAELTSLTSRHRANASSVVEAALRQFIGLPVIDRERAVRETRGSKTRTGWMSGFWEALAEEFGRTDFAHGDSARIYALRSYGDFDLVFLLHSATQPDPDDRDFILHIMTSSRATGDKPGIRETIYFRRGQLVYDAVRRAAARFRELQAAAAL